MCIIGFGMDASGYRLNGYTAKMDKGKATV